MSFNITANSGTGFDITLGSAPENYTSGFFATLPTDNADLTNPITPADVLTDDNTFATETGGLFVIHQFKYTNDNNTDNIVPTWKGKSDIATSDSTMFLQIYNYITPGWETLDTDTATALDTEFTLTGTQSTNLSDYYSTNQVSIRVYQAYA